MRSQASQTLQFKKFALTHDALHALGVPYQSRVLVVVCLVLSLIPCPLSLVPRPQSDILIYRVVVYRGTHTDTPTNKRTPINKNIYIFIYTCITKGGLYIYRGIHEYVISMYIGVPLYKDTP